MKLITTRTITGAAHLDAAERKCSALEAEIASLAELARHAGVEAAATALEDLAYRISESRVEWMQDNDRTD